MEETKKQKKIEWNPNLPLSMLPEEIRESFIKEAKLLYDDLLGNKQVVRVAAPWPGYNNRVRAVESYPPQWYSRLYDRLSHNRDRTLEALLRIANLKDGEFKGFFYKTDAVLRDFIFYCLMEGYEERGDDKKGPERDLIISQNKKVREHFIVR